MENGLDLEFIKGIINGGMNRDLERVIKVQIKNLEITLEASKLILKNYGEIYDEIETGIKKDLERVMTEIGMQAMAVEKQKEELEKELAAFK